jgi:hypothetical protein
LRQAFAQRSLQSRFGLRSYQLPCQLLFRLDLAALLVLNQPVLRLLHQRRRLLCVHREQGEERHGSRRVQLGLRPVR